MKEKKKKTQLFEDERPLTLTQAARRLGIFPGTLRKSIENGIVKAFRIGERGHYRIQRAEIERIINGGKK